MSGPEDLERAPLRTHLRDPAKPASIERIRERVFARSSPSRRPVRLLPWVLAGTLALVGWLFWSAPPQELRTAAGQQFVSLAAVSGAARQEFSDGSSIELAAGGRVLGLASTEQDFVLLLEEGELDVHVVPGGPRRWIIEAKLARIEVVGTRFHVTRKEGLWRVSVSEGAVLVRSELLPQGVSRVSAGESLELLEPRSNSATTRGSSLEEERSPKPPELLERARAEQARLARREGASNEPPRRAGGAPEQTAEAPRAVAAPRPALSTARELFDAADRARSGGDLQRAERLLERLLRDFSTASEGTLAAVSLGVLRAKRPGGLPQAIEAFELALQKSPSRSVRQDVLHRLVEAHLSLGQRERAEQRAAEYRAWFPDGRYLEDIEASLRRASTP